MTIELTTLNFLIVFVLLLPATTFLSCRYNHSLSTFWGLILNFVLIIVLGTVSIVNAANVSVKEQLPNQWYAFYQYINKNEDPNTQKEAILDFKEQFNCPAGLSRKGFNILRVWMQDQTKPLFEETFNECVEKTQFNWSDKIPENKNDH